MGKRGRQPVDLDRETFEKLCGIQCTEEEICAVMGVTEKTLADWCRRTYGMKFSQIFREKRGGGKASLRRTQWQLAKKSPAMAIWLGKQYLGQRENPAEQTQAQADDGFLQALSNTAKEDWNEGGGV